MIEPFVYVEAKNLGFVDSGKGWWWCGWCSSTSMALHGMRAHRQLCIGWAWRDLVEVNS